jgi:hypothetical protein
MAFFCREHNVVAADELFNQLLADNSPYLKTAGQCIIKYFLNSRQYTKAYDYMKKLLQNGTRPSRFFHRAVIVGLINENFDLALEAYHYMRRHYNPLVQLTQGIIQVRRMITCVSVCVSRSEMEVHASAKHIRIHTHISSSPHMYTNTDTSRNAYFSTTSLPPPPSSDAFPQALLKAKRYNDIIEIFEDHEPMSTVTMRMINYVLQAYQALGKWLEAYRLLPLIRQSMHNNVIDSSTYDTYELLLAIVSQQTNVE